VAADGRVDLGKDGGQFGILTERLVHQLIHGHAPGAPSRLRERDRPTSEE
jgi:hypothetical protein